MKIIIEQEKMLHDFNIRSDGETASKLLHNDFIEIWYSWKTHTHDSTINSFNKEEKPDYKIHSQDFYVTESTDNLIQILYKTAHIHSDWYITKYSKRSSIWVLNNDTWQMKYHQGTPSNQFEIQT